VFFRRNGEKKWLAIVEANDLCEIARHIAPPNFVVDVVATHPVATTVAQGFVIPSTPINPNKIQ
jgi:hypothetical protein